MRVIGTAGHVDHGKSTLVTALTGINPDRLKEEQEREMTIDLGFAWFQLEDEEIGIVDVPGHRDFIKNMLAGVSGIDAALLIIAADEGIMPQTREHLAILDLLRIPTGMVIITKIDLVKDTTWLELIESDIQDTLRGTFLQDAPIVRVSSKNRDGFPELLQSLKKILQNLPTRPDHNRPRLPVDRVFTITGFGTVVTGTLSDGQLTPGEEIEILPANLRGRIRGLQTHKKKEKIAIPGSRVALNITGINAEDIQRGDVVTYPGIYYPTQRIDVRFKLLPTASCSLRHTNVVKIFIGSAETIANIRLLDKEVLSPGQTGWLQLELRHPVVTVRGDRFIIRRPSPSETLGGGAIVDPHPKHRHRKFDHSILKSLEAMEHGTPSEQLLQTCQTLCPILMNELVKSTQFEVKEALSIIEELITSGQLVALEEYRSLKVSNVLLITKDAWLTFRDKIIKTLITYHKNYPLRNGIVREELKSRLNVAARVFNASIKTLTSERILEERGTLVSLVGHSIALSPTQKTAIELLMNKFSSAAYTPPSIKECKAEIGEELFNTLINMEELVVVSPEVVFSKNDFENMVKEIRKVIKQKNQINLAEVRDLFSTSRRYAQAFMEYLDKMEITVREGDTRRLKN